MTAMWNLLLRSDLPPDLLEGMDYAVFGLGDTAYEKFCWAAKKLARRLENLGGRELCPRGEGDEQHPLGYVCSSYILIYLIIWVQNRGGFKPMDRKAFPILARLVSATPRIRDSPCGSSSTLKSNRDV